MSAHESLEVLEVKHTPLSAPTVIYAFSASALAINLRDLNLKYCNLLPASVPALARLIQGGALESLVIDNGEIPLLDEAAAVQLADAVAASRTLTRLKLESSLFWDDATAAAAVMRALTGHPRLQEVGLSWNDAPDQLAAGAALGALVATNTPALQTLDVQWSRLGDAGLGGLCDALPRNTHLRELKLQRTGMTVAFARHTLWPSVRANTSLRILDINEYWGGAQTPPEVLEAAALLTARHDDDG